ncbi:MAG: COX15/CtaA family protein [Phreatobacter sp.]|uniref:COX15/CtaA family protein n=1 Tax=Phreatobacter sp. TaxID=1966341 RepID=UPI001A45B431|nr:COX15/CtaA family protein [Phreatobacter sp.]MBL8570007.1 COX15/CtaA family protein [Phreatobacter sp.]
MTAVAARSASPQSDRIVRLWLFGVAALVFAIVVVGGATRLTDSGLSITEWKPVTGALPPLSHAQWLEEFAKYRASPQYDAINRGMSLGDFQFIFWWEWAHRFLGRLIGAAMLLPWLFFVAKGWLRGRLAAATFGIGVLMGVQGLVGWLMVASGLEPGMVYVAPLKLMFHLTLACLIFALLVWVALGLGQGREREAPPDRVRWGGIAVLALLALQIALGALVAGNRAGMRFNDWPLMDGAWIPPANVLFDRPTVAEAFVDSLALVQFNHRLAAYALLALALWHMLAARGTAFAKGAVVLFGLIAAQAVIGIVTLMLVVPLWAGLAHQGFAVLVLGHALAHVHGLTRARRAGREPMARALPAE